jgi:uncharacterized Zn finger protein (UPF0148 family)
MSDIVNRIAISKRCSRCGEDLFRVQYTKEGDSKIHTLDYCPKCDKELDRKYLEGFEKERELAIRLKELRIVFMIVASVLLGLIIMKFV